MMRRLVMGEFQCAGVEALELSVVAAEAGNSILKQAPPEGKFSAQIVAPWASTIRLQIDSPKPTPVSLVVTKGSKIRVPKCLGRPSPLSNTSSTTVPGPIEPVGPCDLTRTFPGPGVASRA